MWEGKTLYRLGKTLPEAYKKWAEKISVDKSDFMTIGQLLDRYLIEVVPAKKPTTQRHNKIAIKRLRSVLGEISLIDIKPQMVYKYVDKRDAKVAAKKEIEILSHAYSKAVEWGIIDKHPFKGEVQLKGSQARTRYVEDWEIVECLSIDSKRKKGSVHAAQAYIRIKLLTGMRKGDMLRITMTDLKEDGIHVIPSKTDETTKKHQIYQWTAELRAAVDQAKAARPVVISPFLFCNMWGQGYVDEETGRTGGFDTLWRNFTARVIAETKVTERFTEHDLRAKCASDAKTLEHAQALLAHADSKITQRVYRRKPELIQPLR